MPRPSVSGKSCLRQQSSCRHSPLERPLVAGRLAARLLPLPASPRAQRRPSSLDCPFHPLSRPPLPRRQLGLPSLLLCHSGEPSAHWRRGAGPGRRVLEPGQDAGGPAQLFFAGAFTCRAWLCLCLTARRPQQLPLDWLSTALPTAPALLYLTFQVEFKNCEFVDNSALNGAGAVALQDGAIGLFSASLFRSNSAGEQQRCLHCFALLFVCLAALPSASSRPPSPAATLRASFERSCFERAVPGARLGRAACRPAAAALVTLPLPPLIHPALPRCCLPSTPLAQPTAPAARCT